MKNGGDFILKEQEVLHCLKKKSKNKLMQKMVYYMFDNYGEFPPVNDIIHVSNALIQLFDKLKDDQGGIVSYIFC